MASANVRVFTATTTHKSDPIPDNWAGGLVQVLVIGATGDQLHFQFADGGDASLELPEIDRSIAATDTGADDDKLGAALLANSPSEPIAIPRPSDGNQIFFAREASATVTVRVELLRRGVF